MADLDLLVPPEVEKAWQELLYREAWRPARIGWVSTNGIILDLHPQTNEHQAMLAREAAPHDAAPGLLPSRPALIATIAEHLQRHGGERLWRDVADMQMLTDDGSRPELIEQAYRLLPPDLQSVLGGLALFINRWGQPTIPYPVDGRGARSWAGYLQRLANLSTDISHSDLTLLASFSPRRGQPAAPKGIGSFGRVVRIDPTSGRLPSSRLGVQWAKARLLTRLVARGQLMTALRLAREKVEREHRTPDSTSP
jgi:hypothetical protein